MLLRHALPLHARRLSLNARQLNAEMPLVRNLKVGAFIMYNNIVKKCSPS